MAQARGRALQPIPRLANALGADPIPRSRSEAQHLIEAMRPQLVVSARTRQVAQLVLTRPAPNRMAEPMQALGIRAAIDLLPTWARRMHGLRNPPLGIPLVRAGTLAQLEQLVGGFDEIPPDSPNRINRLGVIRR